jgi:hypothetical protein
MDAVRPLERRTFRCLPRISDFVAKRHARSRHLPNSRWGGASSLAERATLCVPRRRERPEDMRPCCYGSRRLALTWYAQSTAGPYAPLHLRARC